MIIEINLRVFSFGLLGSLFRSGSALQADVHVASLGTQPVPRDQIYVRT